MFYGAIPDDELDDTTAIQAAFNACIAAKSGTILIPQGNYKHTALALAPASSQIHCNIQGEGGAGAFGVRLTYTGTGGTALTIKNNTRYNIENVAFIDEGTGARGLFLTSLTPGSNHGNFEYKNVRISGFTTDLQLGEATGEAVADGVFTNLEVSNATTGILLEGNTSGALGGANFTTLFQFNHFAASFNTTTFKYTGPQGSNQTNLEFIEASQGQNTLEFDLQSPVFFKWSGYSESQNQAQFMKSGSDTPTLNSAVGTFINITDSYIAYPSTPSNRWAHFNQPGHYSIKNTTIATGSVLLGGFDGGGGARKSDLKIEQSVVITSDNPVIYRAGSNTVWNVCHLMSGDTAEEAVNTDASRCYLILADGSERILSRLDWNLSAGSLNATSTLDGIANVKAFGATGDGVTDDSTAVQAAATAATGNALFIPTGTYIVKGINVPANTRLFGPGTLKLKALSALDGSPILNINGNGVTIDGVSFDGNRSNQAADGFSDSFNTGANNTGRAYRAAIKCDSKTDLTVRNSTFTATYGGGIVTKDCSRVMINGNHARNLNFEFAWIGGSDGDITDINIINNQADTLASGDGTVQANGILVYKCSRFALSGNNIYNVERSHIKIEGCSHGSFNNNTLHTQTLTGGWPAITVQSSSGTNLDVADISISGNTMTGTGAGITVNPGSTGTAKRVSVSSNVINSTTGSSGLEYCILFGANAVHEDINISNNVCKDIKSVGIYLNGSSSSVSSRIKILGNTLYGNGGGGQQGMYFHGEFDGLTVENNYVAHFSESSGGDGVISSDGDTITNLLLRGNSIFSGSSSNRGIYLAYGTNTISGRLENNYVEGTINSGHPNTLHAFGNYSTGVNTAGINQANLGSPGNGATEYCIDCTVANPCAGGGNGAIAKRLNGAWVCN
jgi:hypothetical protein